MIDEAQPILIFQQNQDNFTGQNRTKMQYLVSILLRVMPTKPQ